MAPDKANKWKAPAELFISANWLQLVLSGRTDKHRGPLISVRAFLQALKDDEQELERFIAAQFFCSPEDAEQFGRSLQAEIDAAEEHRRELRLSDFDEEEDDWQAGIRSRNTLFIAYRGPLCGRKDKRFSA